MLSIDFFYFNIPSFAICHLFFQGVEKRRGKILRKETNYVHFLYILPLPHSVIPVHHTSTLRKKNNIYFSLT